MFLGNPIFMYIVSRAAISPHQYISSRISMFNEQKKSFAGSEKFLLDISLRWEASWLIS